MHTFTLRTARWLGIACLSALIPAAQAGVVLDAHFDGPGDNSGGYITNLGIDISQTFTVLNQGTLSSISFTIVRTVDFSGPLTVDIRPLAGGFPNAFAASALFSTTLSPAQIGFPGIFNVAVDVSPGNISVTPGEMLAITLSSDASVGGARWAFTTGNPYAGGHGYFRGDGDGVAFITGGGDQLFDTFVNTAPEPGSLLLGASGLLLTGIGAGRKRRRAVRR
jgi:hypothetical protein